MTIKINKPTKLHDEIMSFKSDADFFNFCVNPEIVFKEFVDKEGNTRCYYDFEFTKAYSDAVEQDVYFVIEDEDSQIFKHGAVSYRSITKEVENLKQYWGTNKCR